MKLSDIESNLKSKTLKELINYETAINTLLKWELFSYQYQGLEIVGKAINNEIISRMK